MSRPYRIVLLALTGLLALASTLPAFTAAEIRDVLTGGGKLTVDNRFTPEDVRSFVAIGGNRVTVVCQGFTPDHARKFLNAGAGLVLDSSFPVADIVTLAQAGRQRVTVNPAGIDPQILKNIVAAGAFLMASSGGGTYGEKMRTLQAGGQAVVDSTFTYNDVANLIAVGRQRVHVMGKGFVSGHLSAFLQQGAIVWVDTSTPAPEILALAGAGQNRLIVKATGFSAAALKSFAQRGAHVVLAFDGGGREARRAMKFEELHGGD